VSRGARTHWPGVAGWHTSARVCGTREAIFEQDAAGGEYIRAASPVAARGGSVTTLALSLGFAAREPEVRARAQPVDLRRDRRHHYPAVLFISALSPHAVFGSAAPEARDIGPAAVAGAAMLPIASLEKRLLRGQRPGRS
jgi:hypothetical protein